MSLILTTIAIALVVWLFFKAILIEIPSPHAIKWMQKINGPSGLPLFLGETLSFIRLEHDGILDYLKELSRKYPRLTGFYLAGVPMVLLQKPQDIKHILSSSRNIKKGIEYETIIPWLNEGLLTSDGLKWHQRRKLLTPTFHFKILDDALPRMVENTDILASRLTTAGKNVIVADYITGCTLDIIGDAAMGVNLGGQTEGGNEYLSYIKTAGEITVDRATKVYQMKEFIFSLSRNGWNFKQCLKGLHGFTDKVIAEKKQSMNYNRFEEEDSFGRKQRKAFLDCLLEMQAANPETFTDRDIREEVDTFMFEGHDTTSAALCFCLWLLGSHQDIQEKLYKEISETIGDGEVTMKAINSMPYLEKVIKETLRMYPSVPYISRRLYEDVILDDGTVIPDSTNVIITPYLLHHDPEFFPEPEKFDPDRFSEEASVNRHPYCYIPFSAGPRNCVGQKFAMTEMKVTITTIIKKLKVTSVTKEGEFKILPHLIIRPTEPILCTFQPRK